MKRLLLLLAATFCVSPIFAQQLGGSGIDGNATVDEMAVKNVNYHPGIPALGGDSRDYAGDITGGLLWDRPFADGSCCSGLGPVTYETQIFWVETTGQYNVRSVQDGWDGYLFVYENSFDPLDQTANFVAGDDDGNGGIGTSDIEGITLTAGTTYIVVTTAFAAGDEGPYVNTIEGPGPIVLDGDPTIPTLGEWGMIFFVGLLAIAAMVMMRRSQARIA